MSSLKNSNFFFINISLKKKKIIVNINNSDIIVPTTKAKGNNPTKTNTNLLDRSEWNILLIIKFFCYNIYTFTHVFNIFGRSR